MSFVHSLQRYESYEWDPHRNGTIKTQSTLKDDEKKISPPLTNNFQPIIIISRLLGCHPHTIFSRKIVKTAKFWKLYSIMCSFTVIIPIIIVVEKIGMCQNRRHDNLRDCIFKNSGKLFVFVNYLMCTSLSAFRASRFESGIAKIQEFDLVTGAKKKIHRLENLLALVVLLAICAIVTWIFTDFSMPTTFLEIHYVMLIGAMSLEIHKFCFVFAAVLIRFVRFGKIVRTRNVSITSTKGLHYQSLTAHDVFILHRILVNAVENLNRYFDIQIVYWYCYFMVSLVMQVIEAADDNAAGTWISPREIGCLLFTVYHPAVLCIFPHFTCKKAKEFGRLSFGQGISSLVTKVQSLETISLGLYLVHRPLTITGFGMFSVDLPLLLTMVIAGTTYTTFIVQAAVEEFHKVVRRQKG